MLVKRTLTFIYLKHLTKERKRPAVSLNVDPTQWSETVSLVADKHHISHKGLTEVMSVVVSSGGRYINAFVNRNSA